MALNDQIQAYLSQNNIFCSPGYYQTGQPEGQPDQVGVRRPGQAVRPPGALSLSRRSPSRP